MSNEAEQLDIIRHSLAHIMAAAINELYKEPKFGVGPVIRDGFYYDVFLENDQTISDTDLVKIEAKMHEVIARHEDFERQELSIEEVKIYFTQSNQPLKVELLDDLAKHGTTSAKEIDARELGIELDTNNNDAKITTVTVYKTENFTDLCRGPHVSNTSELDKVAFKLTKVSGAYWRGDEKRQQMQRIYGVAFEAKAELDEYLKNQAEAEKRDHRKLGRELDLFVFSDLVGPGLPLWTPRGTIIRQELDRFVQELRNEHGFEAVAIPHITKKDLYQKSGHWEKFKDELFRIKTREGHDFALKPMNCPHHTQIYASQPRSYKDLPIRYRETTMVYRDEQSGELSGLSRVRSITQDDAHIFCRSSQIKEEILKAWDIVARFYDVFDMKLKLRLSTHDPAQMDGYVGTTKQWDMAVSQLREVIEEKGITDYIEGVGEAAFYAPKLDFIGEDVLGRQFQASTIQLDFVQPKNFGLTCTNEKGEAEDIFMLHCAVSGSLERMMVLLIEHYAGAFPIWLAPEQVRIIPVSDKFNDYAVKIATNLEENGIRHSVDDNNESLGKRIRQAETMKIPYVLVVGEKEVAANSVAVRHISDGDQGAQPVAAFLAQINDQIYQRT